MRINNNLMAMNTYRQLGIGNNNTSRSMEKLSSGLRINRAGDDAAGMAISEKMRGQIRGLSQASRNAQDGISLVQSAEGALQETQSILQRMRELAVQSSNDTNVDADRAAIQNEISQLIEEVDRIADTTEFNKQKLLDGSLGANIIPGVNNANVSTTAFGQKAAATFESNDAIKSTGNTNDDDIEAYNGSSATIYIDGVKIDFAAAAADYIPHGDGGGNVDGVALAAQLQTDINAAITTYNSENGTSLSSVVVEEANADQLTITTGSVGSTSSIHIDNGADDRANLWGMLGFTASTTHEDLGENGVFSAVGVAMWDSVTNTDKSIVTVDGVALEVTWDDVGGQASTQGHDMSGASYADKLKKDINDAIAAYNATVPAEDELNDVSVSVVDGKFVVESGSTGTSSSIEFDDSVVANTLGLRNASDETQAGGVEFQIGANSGQKMQVSVESMDKDGLGIADIDLSTKTGAENAIDTIDIALEKVSSQRSSLGAVQNRLEHSIRNLDTSAENLTAAESRIRDVDMAKEMMNFTKNNILQQAAQSMLAQANQAPQGVLQLLR